MFYMEKSFDKARLLMYLSSMSNLKKINSCHHFFQKGLVSGLILVRPPTAWKERLDRKPQLIQAAR